MYADTDLARPSSTARRAAATCSAGSVIAIFVVVIPNIIPVPTRHPPAFQHLGRIGLGLPVDGADEHRAELVLHHPVGRHGAIPELGQRHRRAHQPQAQLLTQPPPSRVSGGFAGQRVPGVVEDVAGERQVQWVSRWWTWDLGSFPAGRSWSSSRTTGASSGCTTRTVSALTAPAARPALRQPRTGPRCPNRSPRSPAIPRTAARSRSPARQSS